MTTLIQNLLGLRDAVRAEMNESRRWNQPVSRESGIRVFYGRDSIPGRGEIAQGGIVKYQDLQEKFPNTTTHANLVYLVSSALPPASEVVIRYAKKAGAKVVLNQNGVAYRAWYGPGWEGANQPIASALRHADYVIYQSHFCKTTADRFVGPVSVPHEVLHNPVDTNAFVPAAQYPESGPVIMMAGSHVQSYRVECAFRVFSEVRRALKDARFVLAGHLGWKADEQSAREEMMNLARQLGFAESLRITGRYTQKEALGLFQSAHILLHTKYNDPCPRLVVEALACGLPVVYSASGGVPELVTPESGVGAPVPEDWDNLRLPDERNMAKGIADIWSNYPAYRKAARDHAVRSLDVKKWLARHEDIFNTLIKNEVM